MATDWRKLSREAGLTVGEGDDLVLPLGDQRQHRVWVEPNGERDLIRIWAVAARPSALPQNSDDAHLLAWKRNRVSDLVGLKVDRRGRLIGEAWVPTAGLDADEWALWVLAVARTCDRIEYLLTGRDED